MKANIKWKILSLKPLLTLSKLKMRAIFFFTFFSSFSLLTGQELINEKANNDIVKEYSRNGLSVIVFDGKNKSKINDKFNSDFVNIAIPTKYDKNEIFPDIYFDEELLSTVKKSRDSFLGIKNPFAKTKKSGEITLSETDSLLISLLNDYSIGMDIADDIFDFNGKEYKLEKLIDRVKYNLTDDEYLNLTKTAKGVEDGVKDFKWISELLDQNFVAVIIPKDLYEMEEKYNRIDSINKARSNANPDIEYKPTERTFRGYGGEFKVNLFQLDFNEEVQDYFWTNIWLDSNSSAKEREANLKNRINFQIPFKLVFTDEYMFESTQAKTITPESVTYKSDEQLLDGLIYDAFEKMFYKFEKSVEAFQVNTTIFGLKKATQTLVDVKIGTKEGLKVGDRYRVYQYKEGKDNSINKVYKGTILSSNKITDNSKVATGDTEPSVFVKTRGISFDEGMLIQQAVWKHITINVGTMHNGIMNFGGRVNYDLSPIIFSLVDQETWSVLPLHFLSFYGDIFFGKTSFSEPYDRIVFNGGESRGSDVTSLSLSFGFQKDFYLFGLYKLSPFLGYRFELASFSDSDLNTSIKAREGDNYGQSSGFDIGSRIGFPIAKDFTISGSLYFSSQKFNEDKSIFAKNSSPSFLNSVEENPFSMERSPIRFEVLLSYDF